MPQLRDSLGRFAGTVENADPTKHEVSLGEMTPTQFDRVVMNTLENASSLRRRIWERVLDTRRDIDDECGYPPTDQLDIQHYRRMYDRNGIANRIVNIYPDYCWKVEPIVFEDDDPGTETPFEAELKQLLRGESLFESDEGSAVWERCYRADRLSGIGQFGLILIGTDDEGELDQPLEFRPGSKSRELLHLTCYSEDLIQIGPRDNDPQSPRFLQPEYYYIDFENATITGQGVQVTPRVNGSSQRGKRVHWTRVIHVAEVTESSEIFATPRIRPNYNRVYDLRKLLGGSVEMYWRGALPPLILSTDPKYGTKVELDNLAEDQFEQLMNTLQRWVFIPAVTPHQLAPTVVDPTNQVEVQLDAICIQLDCPKRIFMGSERGELASSQDKDKWNGNVKRRQTRYVTPRIIVPLIDRFINLGILTQPKKYGVSWPELDSIPLKDQAEIALRRTEALVKFIQGDGESGMSLMDFWTIIQGLTDEEAEGVVERAMEHREEQEEEERLQMEEFNKQQEKLAKAGGVPPAGAKPPFGKPPGNLPMKGGTSGNPK